MIKKDRGITKFSSVVTISDSDFAHAHESTQERIKLVEQQIVNAFLNHFKDNYFDLKLKIEQREILQFGEKEYKSTLYTISEEGIERIKELEKIAEKYEKLMGIVIKEIE